MNDTVAVFCDADCREGAYVTMRVSPRCCVFWGLGAEDFLLGISTAQMHTT